MRVEVKVPQLPESVAEATLVSWHKKAGDAVARDENLIDVETDKVVLELPAPQAGVLVEIRKADGATVAGQEVIAVIDTDAKAPLRAAAATAAAAAPAATAAPRPQRRAPRRARGRGADRAARGAQDDGGPGRRSGRRSTAPAAAAGSPRAT